jgi:hypothetical protein
MASSNPTFDRLILIPKIPSAIKVRKQDRTAIVPE